MRGEFDIERFAEFACFEGEKLYCVMGGDTGKAPAVGGSIGGVRAGTASSV